MGFLKSVTKGAKHTFKRTKDLAEDTGKTFKKAGKRSLGDFKRAGESTLKTTQNALQNKYIRATASGVAGMTVGAAGSMAVETLAESKDTKPADLPGKMIRYYSNGAQQEAKVMAVVGPFLVLVGRATAQPELVAVGEGMEKVADVIMIVTAGGEEISMAVDAGLHGDKKAMVHALGDAAKQYGAAVYQYLAPEQTDELLVAAGMIISGRPEAGLKAAATALIKEAIYHEVPGSEDFLNAAESYGILPPTVTQEQREKYGAQKGIDAAAESVFGKSKESDSKEKSASTGGTPEEGTTPGGGSTPEEGSTTSPGEEDQDMDGTSGDSSATTTTTTTTTGDNGETTITTTSVNTADRDTQLERAKELERLKDRWSDTPVKPVNQNIDQNELQFEKIAMYGQGAYEIPPIKVHLKPADGCGCVKPPRKREYSALKVLPSQLGNAADSTSLHGPRPAKVAKQYVNTSHPKKKELGRRPVTRGYTANYTQSRRMATTGLDARGETVEYVDQVNAAPGTMQADSTQLELERSMKIWHTKAQDDVSVRPQGPNKGHSRSRTVRRSANRKVMDVTATPARKYNLIGVKV